MVIWLEMRGLEGIGGWGGVDLRLPGPILLARGFLPANWGPEFPRSAVIDMVIFARVKDRETSDRGRED